MVWIERWMKRARRCLPNMMLRRDESPLTVRPLAEDSREVLSTALPLLGHVCPSCPSYQQKSLGHPAFSYTQYPCLRRPLAALPSDLVRQGQDVRISSVRVSVRSRLALLVSSLRAFFARYYDCSHFHSGSQTWARMTESVLLSLMHVPPAEEISTV